MLTIHKSQCPQLSWILNYKVWRVIKVLVSKFWSWHHVNDVNWFEIPKCITLKCTHFYFLIDRTNIEWSKFHVCGNSSLRLAIAVMTNKRKTMGKNSTFRNPCSGTTSHAPYGILIFRNELLRLNYVPKSYLSIISNLTDSSILIVFTMNYVKLLHTLSILLQCPQLYQRAYLLMNT